MRGAYSPNCRRERPGREVLALSAAYVGMEREGLGGFELLIIVSAGIGLALVGALTLRPDFRQT